MVDTAIEFDVVTADGQLRIINQCNDPDLFWAMRGGGGSTYAVLLNYKVQLFPEVPLHMFAFQADFPTLLGIPINGQAILTDLVGYLANDQELFANNSLAGYNFYYPQR